MKLISHRRNTIQELINTPRKYGVEVDIRSYGEDLIIHHDPYVKGERFEDWISVYQHGTLILNVKEEGLESKLIGLMEKKGIKDYFFLDQSFPFLVKTSKMGIRDCAVRVSEYESIETAMTLAGKIDWVWVDCFTHFPLKHADANKLKEGGFKICLVSPELQGRDARTEITYLMNVLKEENIQADAVCTKHPEFWESIL